MGKEMTKRERVEAALNLQPVDRVPVYDLLRNDAVMEHYAGERLSIEDGMRVACKAVANCLDLTRSIVGPAEEKTVDSGNGWVTMQKRWTTWIVKRPFDDPEGAAEWMERDLEARKARLKGTEQQGLSRPDFLNVPAIGMEREQFRNNFLKLQAMCGDSVIMHSENGVGIDALYHSIGWENFACILADQPDLVSEWLEHYSRNEIRWIHACADRELSPVALTYGDIACKNTTLFSPAWLRKEFMPRLKRLNEAWHEHGVKCMFHSDGYLMDVMEDLIETGIDGLNPIEIGAGMNLKQVKDLYGDKIFIAGGIDVSQLLPLGKPEEVHEACEQAIQDTGGIGFLMGSTTELHDAVPLENFQAMVDVAWNTRLG